MAYRGKGFDELVGMFEGEIQGLWVGIVVEFRSSEMMEAGWEACWVRLEVVKYSAAYV